MDRPATNNAVADISFNLPRRVVHIMKVIDGVASKIDHLNGRIDGLMKPAASRARTG